MQVPLLRTVCSTRDYARAFIMAWIQAFGSPPTQAQCGVLYAQWMVETSGKHCWNWNIGNVKVTQAQVDAGVPWIDLPGTFEFIAGKRVTLPEGHLGRRFRAYASLEAGMSEHLGFLRKRFATCWPAVEAGDPDAFAHRLKEGRDGKEGTADDYYTAPSADYARIMVGAHKSFMMSRAFDDAMDEIDASDNEPTQPEIQLHNLETDPPPPIVHPSVFREPDDEPPEAA